MLCLRLDRLTRRVVDLGKLLDEFERRDVRIASVVDAFDTTTANGRLVLNVLASVSLWERDMVSERTAEAMARLKEAGRRVGAAPYGLAWNGDDLVPVPGEISIVLEMKKLRRRRLSFSAIARKLNDLGWPARMGRAWSHTQVASALRNSRVRAAIATA